MDMCGDEGYNMVEWLVYCDFKNQLLAREKGRFCVNFEDAIEQIEKGDF